MQYKAKINPFNGMLQLVPTNIVLAFKTGVATQASLPLSGNAVGDARIANDTGHLYVWSIESSSGLLTDWVDAGDIVDLNWSAISGRPSSAVADIDDAVGKRHSPESDNQVADTVPTEDTGISVQDALNALEALSHTQETDKYLTTMVTNTLYVDMKRTDIYIADGSLTKPYLTIQSAINKVISNGDNSETKVYVIKISSGIYAENVVLNNALIKELVMIGEPGSVQITPATGYSLECSSNNGAFRTFMVKDIDFGKDVYIVGSAGSPTWRHTWVNDCWFVNSGFWGKLTVKNVVCFGIAGSYQNVDNDWDLENVYIASLSNGNGHNPGQTINVITDMAKPHYVDFDETLLLLEATLCGNVNIGVGSRVQFRYAVRMAGTTLTINGILQAYSSWIGAGTITLGATGTFTARGTFWTPSALTITPGGTLTRETYAGCIRNIPAGNISATDVQSAINELDTEKVNKVTGSSLVPDTEISKIHEPNSDDQTAETVETEDTGISVQDALNIVEADKSDKSVTINTQTTDYTLVLTDIDKLIDMNCESGSGILTVPKNSVVAFPIGTTVAILQSGSVEITITPVDGDVTINNQNGLVTTGQYAVASLLKVDTNTWIACGALGV